MLRLWCKTTCGLCHALSLPLVPFLRTIPSKVKSGLMRALLCTQLELGANETLAKHWKRLAKKEAAAAAAAATAGDTAAAGDAAAEGGPAREAHVPVIQRPEATFLPSLLSEFLEVSRHCSLACL